MFTPLIPYAWKINNIAYFSGGTGQNKLNAQFAKNSLQVTWNSLRKGLRISTLHLVKNDAL